MGLLSSADHRDPSSSLMRGYLLTQVIGPVTNDRRCTVAHLPLVLFGTALHEMRTGHLPFRAKVLQRFLHNDPLAVLRLNRDLPTKLEDIVGRALDRELR